MGRARLRPVGTVLKWLFFGTLRPLRWLIHEAFVVGPVTVGGVIAISAGMGALQKTPPEPAFYQVLFGGIGLSATLANLMTRFSPKLVSHPRGATLIEESGKFFLHSAVSLIFVLILAYGQGPVADLLGDLNSPWLPAAASVYLKILISATFYYGAMGFFIALGKLNAVLKAEQLPFP